LHALQDIQQFHLIEFESETGLVRLTGMGSRAAVASSANEIRTAASHALP
jgi:hypothetical protein